MRIIEKLEIRATFSQQRLSVEGHRFHNKRIYEDDYQDGNHRRYIDTSKPVRRNESSQGTKSRLCQTMQDDDKGIQGRNIDPRKNRPDDDNPHINPQDDMENPGYGGQQVAEKNHLLFLS